MGATTLQDRDLKDFLERVEDYDSMHFKNIGRSGTKPPLKQKPEQLKSSFSKESLERARKLLDGEQLVGVEKYKSKDTTDRIPTSDLAYKSAYNYDKTFSPKKSRYPEEINSKKFEDSSSGTDNSKTFVISEEDYKLLQQLKSDKHKRESNPEEISTRRLPSRGRPRERLREGPREQRIVEDEIEERPPSLPARRSHTLSAQGPKDATHEKNMNIAENPPLKPARNGRFQRQDHENSIQMEKKKSSAPPPIPPKRQRPRTSVPESQPQKLVLDTEPKTYLSSLENNKLTVFDNHVSQTSRPIKPSHIDYLDSVQMKNPTSIDAVSPSGKNVVKISPTSEVNHSESFIKSALKTMETTPSSKSTQNLKPLLPAKPSSLRKATLNDSGNLNRQERAQIDTTPVNEAASVKLRSREKTKPKVPAKNNDLIIPKLREVNPASMQKKTDFASLDEGERTGKYGASEKMSILKSLQGRNKDSTTPEALLKLKKLNKTVTDDNCTDDKPIAEAVAKLGRLQRVKDSPPVPQRKISMPEALKKAEALRNRQPRPPAREVSRKAELETILTVPRLPMRQSHDKNPVKSEIAISSALESPMGGISTKVTPSSDREDSGVPKALKHFNKDRARGPKRKLPSKVQ